MMGEQTYDIDAAVLVVIVAAVYAFIEGYSRGYEKGTEQLLSSIRRIKDDELRKNIVEDMYS